MSILTSPFKAAAASTLAILLTSPAAFSATGVTWNGATDTDFEVGSNWVGSVAPANSLTTNYAIFTGTPTANQPSLTTGRSIAGLQFGSTAGWNFGGAQQLTLGNALTVGGTGSVSVDASALTSGTDTLSMDRVHLNGTNDGNPSVWIVGTGGTLQVDHRVTDGQMFFGDGTTNGTLILGNNTSASEDNGSLNVRVVSGTVLLNKVSDQFNHAASELKIYGGTVKVTGSGGRQLYQGGLLEVRSGGTFDLNGHSELIGSLASFDGSTGGIIDNTSATAATLTVTGGNGWTYNGIIKNTSGALSLVVDNASNGNAVRLAGNSTFSGGTTIKSGELRVSGGDNHNNALGTGTITIGDIANTGAAATLKYNGGGETTFTNAISVVGTGLNTLTADDWNPTFSGAVTLSSNLTLSSTNPFGSTIRMTGGVTGTGNITISANASNGGSRVEFNTGAVNNTGTITNNGTGVGDTNIYSTIGSNVTGVVQNSATSKLFLNAGNSYGTTTVTSGILEVSGSGSLGSGTVTVSSGGILTLGSFTSINDTGALIVDAGATINLNFGSNTEIIGSLFSSSGSQFVPVGTYSAAVLNGNYGFGASTFGGTGFVQVTAVPEPAVWALMAPALLVVVVTIHRRRRVMQ